MKYKTFFARFDIDISLSYGTILKMEYGRLQPIAYLFAKIERMIAVCDFLGQLAQEQHADVDKSKIFQLISHAEIAMNTLFPVTNLGKNEIVKKYFEPVKSQLEYTFRLSIEDTNKLSKKGQDTSAANILYKLRNEYAHQGDFTGRIFSKENGEDGIYTGFGFGWDYRKGNELIPVNGETNLTYSHFLNIYFSAFEAHLKTYITEGDRESDTPPAAS